MTTEQLLADVSAEDPCGPNLQWEADFTKFLDIAERATTLEPSDVIEASKASPESPTLEETIAMGDALLRRTKDLRLLTVLAELHARSTGMAGFARAMEDLVCTAEKWADPRSGVHPRADESDGDLAERAAPVGKLIYRMPGLIATTEWVATDDMESKRNAAQGLKGVFEHWAERMGSALGPELPAIGEVWNTLSARLPKEDDTDDGAAQDAGSASRRPASRGRGADAWELVEAAATQMAIQDRHSPARMLLELMVGWRELNLIEIADAMKESGISLEQLLDSVKKQKRDPV